jgi:alcohol dehydrogenase (cytochrome c)
MRILVVFLALEFSVAAQQPQLQDPDIIAAGRKQFESRCAACHGGDGAGGERGPSIVDTARARNRSAQELEDLLRNGIPASGMPGFDLPKPQLQSLVAFVRSLTAFAAEASVPGSAEAGEKLYFGKGNCASCHMLNGEGSWIGPDLSNLGRQRRLAEIEQSLRDPSAAVAQGFQVVKAHLRNAQVIRGLIKNESNYDLQLLSLDGRFHLFRNVEVLRLERENKSLMPALQASEEETRDLLAFLVRPPASLKASSAGTATTPAKESPDSISMGRVLQPNPGDWPTYHGRLSGNRHGALNQIHAGNVAGLVPRWVFPLPNSQRLQVTPLVVDGVMYVTSVNEAYALDARNGRAIWHFQRPRTKGVVGDAAGGINRGVAILGDRVFMVTDNAHLLALHRLNGRLLWDVEMADSRQNYGATSAPLIVRDLVISGTSGGDEGARGFVSAYTATTGERVWRFWTIPAPGEALSETWKGKALPHGCGTTWLTGTYDPRLDLLYWTTGNPCPDYNGDERKGDNLYSDSVLALKPGTGELRWYYQYTPHDVHDWDSVQTPMLIDAQFKGRERKLLVQANRNGFFYVLDRANGALLLAAPFVRKLTWASAIGPDGRPQELPGTEPSMEGVTVCPAVEGATNWMSTAYNPGTGLFYVMALEKCSVYTKSASEWEAGQSFYGGTTKDVRGEEGRKFLRAIDIQTGKIVWEYEQVGEANSWGGVLSTSGGLVFFGDDSGAFAAVDAKTGKALWHFHTNQTWKASPMTYAVGGKQYVAVAAGSNILAFTLP